MLPTGPPNPIQIYIYSHFLLTKTRFTWLQINIRSVGDHVFTAFSFFLSLNLSCMQAQTISAPTLRLIFWQRSNWCCDPSSEMDGGISILFLLCLVSLCSWPFQWQACEEHFIGPRGVTPGKMKGCGEQGCKAGKKLQCQLSLKCHKLFFRGRTTPTLILRTSRTHWLWIASISH